MRDYHVFFGSEFIYLSAITATYAMAVHELIGYNTWAPFRANYSWLAGKHVENES